MAAKQGETGIDSRDRKRRVGRNELHAKTILPELRSVQKATSYQFMNKFVPWLCIVLGVIAVIGTGFWCLIAKAFGGWPRSAAEFSEVLALLLMGPLSLLPAGIVGLKRPKFAGVWLVGGSLAFFFWHLCVTLDNGFAKLFASSPTFEAWVPITVVCLPMIFLGFTLSLMSGSASLPTKRRTIPLLAAVHISLLVLAIAAVCVTKQQTYWRHTWTLTVRPLGTEPSSVRFQTRGPIWTSESEWKRIVGNAVEPLFAKLGSADRIELGSCELRGPGSEENVYSFAIVLDRKFAPNNAITIYCNDHWVSGDPAPGPLNNARSGMINEVEKVVRGHRYAP